MEASTVAATRVREGTAASLAYSRTGVGDPLVLLHPLGANRHVWRPLFPHLQAKRELICFDLPGFGDSPVLSGARPPIPARLAAAVLGALAAMGLEGSQCHLAGNSLGGWVALEAAAAGHAASVTAIAPAGLWSAPLAPKPQIARQISRLASPVLGPAMRSAALRRIALGGSIAHPERMSAAAASNLIRAYAHSPGSAAVNQAMRANVFTQLSEIEVPVTLVWPEHDKLITRPRTLPSHVHEIRLADCGHVPMWDDPVAVAAALIAGSQIA
jgi:pimeloyl-ACP methyl ester carboxylesterase